MRRTSDSNSAVITFGSGSDSKKDSRSWCPSCAKVGINSPLKHRIYLDEQGKITSPQSDAKNWRQCWQCSLIVPVYEAKVEADIETLTEPRPTGFNNPSSSGTDRAEESILPDESGNRLKRHRKKKRKQDLEQYKEHDIKDALRKGQKLLSYSEHL